MGFPWDEIYPYLEGPISPHLKTVLGPPKARNMPSLHLRRIHIPHPHIQKVSTVFQMSGVW